MKILELIQKLDKKILLWIQMNLRCNLLTSIMKGITFLGDAGWFWIVIAMISVCFKKTRKIGVCIGAALTIGTLITNGVLKNLAKRVRPYNHMEKVNLLIDEPTDWSFPSGHTTASFAAAGIIAKMKLIKHGGIFYLLATLIGISRMYLGVHYPSDVLIGAFIGLFSSRIVYGFCRRYYKI